MNYLRRHIRNFSIRECKIEHSFEAQPYCTTHNQFAEDCDDASKTTTMLIPDVLVIPVTNGFLFIPRVLDQYDRVLLRAQVARTDEHEAWSDAREAVDLMCYERRHQLQLL